MYFKVKVIIFILYFSEIFNLINMSVAQGNEETLQESSVETHPTCGACASLIKSKSHFIKTNCGHTFHKTCLAKCEKIRPYCPICNSRLFSDPVTPSTSGACTRSQARATSIQSVSNQANEDPPSSASTIPTGTNVSENTVNVRPSELQDMISSIVSAQQAQLLASLGNQISRLVQSNIESQFSRLNLNGQTTSNSTAQAVNPQNSPRQMHTLPAVEERTFREIFGISLNTSQNNGHLNTSRSLPATSNQSASSDLSSRPDKVLHIMSNWRIKFTGNSCGLSVENFIYRIESLTMQTLQGDFDLLCRNASSLFEGKAADWFWRYHRSVPLVSWSDLCRALRQQYSDSRSDVDIRELIRDRKQKLGESFDNFHDSVVELTDRLKEPLSNGMLVEILRRNLLPEIQHEILNLKITSIQELRDICRRREFFLQDLKRKHGSGLSKPIPVGKKVYGLDEVVVGDDSESLSEENEQISSLSLTCWNCHQEGHRYQDCLSERTIFCYGCGAVDTYKPSCKRCNPKNCRFGAQTGAPKRKPEME